MSFLPPWLGLILLLLCLGGLAAWVLQRGLKRKVFADDSDVQSQINRQIHQQHLADVDRALREGRLNTEQHRSARDELLRHVLDDAAQAVGSRSGGGLAVSWLWIVVALVLLSGLSYLQLGAPQSWWAAPLSQRVKISATTPEKLVEQTRYWLQTTQESPEDAVAWLTLARLHAAQNEYALSDQALARVLSLAPEPDLWIERAQMKALSLGGIYAGEPWQWIENVLREKPLHLNALVLAGSAALSEKKYEAAQAYWQRALALVPDDSEAAQGIQQALTQIASQAQTQRPEVKAPANSVDERPLIQGEVRVSSDVQTQIGAGATLFVYALAEDGSRRPVAIWRGTPAAWPVRFGLSDSMGMGAPPLLSSLTQVRLVARISKTGSAQKQEGDFQVELPGVKTGVQGVVLQISGR
ncbi:c-type cytochrome biogenesis protein CcmI [Limnohabitans sp. Rim8]|uniref:c-type cytochrome biogenesis protein CcmI n=1 Tax=Limnohabitans sp. Rim8 TaxID=1100718 RepID=UPI00262458C2|nr:c-type cytochrome biogenesis protein CcmI [Limnohabitans sp. Rim8]